MQKIILYTPFVWSLSSESDNALCLFQVTVSFFSLHLLTSLPPYLQPSGAGEPRGRIDRSTSLTGGYNGVTGVSLLPQVEPIERTPVST